MHVELHAVEGERLERRLGEARAGGVNSPLIPGHEVERHAGAVVEDRPHFDSFEFFPEANRHAPCACQRRSHGRQGHAFPSDGNGRGREARSTESLRPSSDAIWNTETGLRALIQIKAPWRSRDQSRRR